MPTINGRKVVNFRIAPKNEIKERIDFHDTATQIVKKAGLKSKVVFAKRKGTKADYNVDTDTIYIEPTSDFKDFLVTVFHEIDHAMDAKRYGWKKFKEMYEMEQNMIAQGFYKDKTDEYWDNKFEIKAEKFGQKNWMKWKNKFKKDGLLNGVQENFLGRVIYTVTYCYNLIEKKA